MTLQCWFVMFHKESDYDCWEPVGQEPYKIFHSHDSAVDFIVKRVAIARDNRKGKVIKHDICPGDGWFYYEWEETIDGVTNNYRMQIAGYPRYVE